MPTAGSDLVEPDDPRRWFGRSALIDLDDPRLRLRASSLAQLATDDRGRAVAIHGYIKNLGLRKRIRTRCWTAREVLDYGEGDAANKAALFVALLRICGIPSRIRFVLVSKALLHGLLPVTRQASRPIVELWMDGGWRRVDTHIFSAAYVAAARQRLRLEKRSAGYGVILAGYSSWNGLDDAWVGAATKSDAQAAVVLADLGVFNDELEFHESAGYRQRHSSLVSMARWCVDAPWMNRVVRQLEWEGRGSGAAA